MSNHPPVKHLQNTGHSWLEPNAPASPFIGYQEFPKRKYHTKKDQSVIVNSPDEEKALGDDYSHTPAVYHAKLKAEAEAQEAADEAAREEKRAAKAPKAEAPAPKPPAK
jgi:hypothetical protein